MSEFSGHGIAVVLPVRDALLLPLDLLLDLGAIFLGGIFEALLHLGQGFLPILTVALIRIVFHRCV